MYLRSASLLFGALLLAARAGLATDPPELSSWNRNTTGQTGYAGLPCGVQLVQYSAGNVYVSASDIPCYSIGPWPGNPNTATNQAFTFRIPRAPQEASSKTATPLGQIGLLRNGVVLFNALDAHSYQNRNVWHQNAVRVEATSFDACLGHPAPSGAYHHHQNPVCLVAANAQVHSPLLGYAFDGYPIYGPYGYGRPDGGGGIQRQRSSYRLRNITVRQTLPDGTALPSADFGPPASAQYPLGYYVEDYEYVAGLGDLDAENGRATVTPEYPGGTYAYFVTIDEQNASAYPYILGPQYHGVLAAGNTGPGGGHVVPSEPVQTYAPVAVQWQTWTGAKSAYR